MTPEFWQLIDDTRPDDRDTGRHATAITSVLVDSGTEDTLRFAAGFEQAIDSLYTFELWGAAYLSFGGCSDDAFEYLRAWIVGSGEAILALARDHPERLFIELLDAADDPDRRWDALGIHQGEALLHAAGIAHERLTGEWLPARSSPYPAEPVGDPWEESDLPTLFPGLSAALPRDWWGEPSSEDSGALRVMIQVESGVAAFSDGDHSEAARLLDSVVDTSADWELVAPDRRIDVAYAVGIGRLLTGDVEGASVALRLVESELGEADHVRRALAQVEMARGDLGSASSFIDNRTGASRYDRVLAAKLAWRQGDREGAVEQATVEMSSVLDPHEHAWDVAGSIHQLGQIFVEAEEAHNAELAANAMDRLLVDAPDHLPLVTHHRLLQAGVLRLRGRPRVALRVLRRLRKGLTGTDLAECLREQARAERALGHLAEADTLYRSAAEAFDGAGERWEAGATTAEQARSAE
jgi:hypothetical protein